MAETLDSSRTGRSDSTRTQLLALIEDADLFHTPEGQAYATVRIGDHSETLPVTGQAFSDYIRAAYFQQHGATPSGMAVHDLIDHAAAVARFSGPEHPVWLRVAEHEGKIYLDLCDDWWRVVEVDQEGWQIITDPPVRFRRPATAKALPVPVPGRGAYLHQLEAYVRLTPENLVLLFAFIVQAVRPKGPYPLLVVTGEQGAGKTFLTLLIKSLVDPSTIPIRAAPRNERDLLISAENTHLLAFNNLSEIPPWLSDALCGLLFGSGLSTRRLHTDRDETVFFYARPIIVNGIEDLTTRPDLADRALVLRLQPISESEQRTESELKKAFEADLPRILGGLLDLTHIALNRVDRIQAKQLPLPRMADFAVWATAAELGFGVPEISFLDAFRANRAETAESALDIHPVVEGIVALLADDDVWEGTVTELRTRLREQFTDGIPADFPRSMQRLVADLQRITPLLRHEGITMQRSRSGRARKTRFTRVSSPDLVA